MAPYQRAITRACCMAPSDHGEKSVATAMFRIATPSCGRLDIAELSSNKLNGAHCLPDLWAGSTGTSWKASVAELGKELDLPVTICSFHASLVCPLGDCRCGYRISVHDVSRWPKACKIDVMPLLAPDDQALRLVFQSAVCSAYHWAGSPRTRMENNWAHRFECSANPVRDRTD